MNCAIEAGLRNDNPVEKVKGPRLVKNEFAIVDREQIPAFIEAAKATNVPNALIFLLLTGLRASELRALQWGDVDLDAASMHIHQQIPCHGAPTFAPPKDNSVRTIELTPQAVNLLRQQRKAQAAARLAAGNKWENGDLLDDLVFRSARGHFLSESVLAKATHATGAKIGIPELHPHDLRHSYAVAALRSGADIKTVQSNLGHKNAAMTLDVYAAYTTDAGKVAAEKLSKYFEGAHI
jgi:integrase